MLSKYNARDIENALIFETPPPLFPDASDRVAWQKVRETVGEEQIAEIIAKAETDAESEIPSLSATMYLEFDRTGERNGYEIPAARRREMLTDLTLAEALEYEGRFLDPLLNVIWSICEESSWSYPAHQRYLTDLDHPIVDLFASLTGFFLAEADHLIGHKLDPLVGKRIRDEIDHRLLTPYLIRHDHWWLYNTQERRVNNWTAVCNANVVGAAIYLEKDMARLAEIIARSARSMDDYLETFDADGGSTEGPGYWSFGFGNYVVWAQLVAHRTNGRVDGFQEKIVRKAAEFPLRTLLSPGYFVNFSDCDRHVSLRVPLLTILAEKFDLPDLMRLAREQQEQQAPQKWDARLNWAVRDLFWPVKPEPAGRFIPNKHDWYSEMMWMIARFDPEDPDALVLAAKGGHNAEMHNQNDVGNLIVHLNGESVIADIGRGRYTRQYFGPERYDHFVNQSLGHSTPVPNGHQQPPGEEYAAQLLEHKADQNIDLMKLEMKNVYPPEAGLASLKRTVAMHRDAPRGWVELVDEVEFESELGTLESALTTFGEVEIDDTTVTLKGEKASLRFLYDPDAVTVQTKLIKDVDLAEGPTDVNRVAFELKEPAKRGTIALRIEPV